jgi:hypothetical protein
MADEETNKLVDEVESEEVKEEKPTEEEDPTEEVTIDPDPVSDEVTNPPAEDVSDVQSIEELFALVKQLQAQIDALTSINTQEEPDPKSQQEQSEQPESQQEQQTEEDPEEIEKLLDL